MALLQPAPAPSPAPDALPHLRRCTFRRLTLIERKPTAIYDADCLFPDRNAPTPLGDLASARPICESCVAKGIFRADED